MAGDANDKTEDPTARRIRQARREGNIGHSADLSRLLGLVAGYQMLHWIGPYLWNDLQLVTKMSFTSSYFREPIDALAAHQGLMALTWILLPELLILLVFSAFFGAGCTLLQTEFNWTMKPLKPKMKTLSPLAGFKRIFSTGNWVNMLKAIVKLSIIFPIAYFAFVDLFPELISLMEVPLTSIIPYTAYAADYIFWKVVKFILIVGILDLIYQKWRTKKKLMMSKQEVKDERKAVEGDETTKRKIRLRGMQRLRDQMFKALPTADVVVTNPTHIAVALKYSLERGKAPQVLAKGRGYVAERIKRIARENNIPVLERKSLARALYQAVEIGAEIPFELYHAVAELLAYVFRIKGKNPFKNKNAGLHP